MAKQKKLESNFINMVLVLFLVTLISSASLGYVYNLTKDKIAASKNAKKMKAIAEVVIPDYDNKPDVDMYELTTRDDTTLECYPAKQGDQVTSVAIKSYTKDAFSGEMWLMVGFLPDGTINKFSVIDQKETPGLGTKVVLEKFRSQFFGKNPKEFNLKVKKDGGDVDAITAATISTRAVCDAIERAYHAYIDSLSE